MKLFTLRQFCPRFRTTVDLSTVMGVPETLRPDPMSLMKSILADLARFFEESPETLKQFLKSRKLAK